MQHDQDNLLRNQLTKAIPATMPSLDSEEGPAQKGALDSQEDLGSFFWLVSRTSTASQANLVLENVTLEHLIKVSLPGPKQRKVASVPWEYSAMPSIPILVNKKTLKQHTQLFVFQKDKQKCEKNKETEKTHNAL